MKRTILMCETVTIVIAALQLARREIYPVNFPGLRLMDTNRPLNERSRNLEHA